MPISDTTFRPGLAVLQSQNPVEAHNGSDCTGADGTANRTLTTTKTMYASTIVIVDSLVMNHATQLSVTGNVITFLDPVFNASKIEVY